MKTLWVMAFWRARVEILQKELPCYSIGVEIYYDPLVCEFGFEGKLGVYEIHVAFDTRSGRPHAQAVRDREGCFV